MCGLSKVAIRYMLTMAVADTMVCIFNVIVGNVLSYNFPDSFLAYTCTCRLTSIIQISCVQFSVWSTVSFTIDRFLAICCQKLKSKYCTERTAAVIITTVCLCSFLIHIPVYFRYEPRYIAGDIRWGCHATAEYASSPAWKTYKWFTKVSVPLLPLPLVLLLNSFTVRHIVQVSRIRSALKRRVDGNICDPEIRNRRTSIILLFAISGSFIALWTPVMILDLSFEVTQSFAFNASRSRFLAIRIALLLMYLSSCTNTCIYALVQRRFREEAKKVIAYPFIIIVRFFKIN